MGSTVSVPGSNPPDTIPRLVQHWSQTVPDREMYVFYNGDRREAYTFRQVFHLAGKFSRRLRTEYGFEKGDIIANTLPNSPERVFTDLGITLAGCTSLNASTIFADGSDFLTSAHNSDLRAVIVCPVGHHPAWRILEPYTDGERFKSTMTLSCDKAPVMKTAILVTRGPTGSGQHFLQELQDSKEEIFVEASVSPDDIATIFTTSGSTGYNKLVPKTNKEIISNWGDSGLHVLKLSKQSWDNNILYNDRPIGWIAGYPFSTYVHGETRVLLDVFETEGSKMGYDTWKIICQERVDYAIIVPVDLDYLLKHTSFDGAANYKLKMVVCGGQRIRRKQVLSYFSVAHEVGVVYGSTENGMMSFGVVDKNNAKDYYCGPVRNGLHIRILDDNGQHCQTGQTGNIQVKGRGVFTGYLNRIENPDPKTLTAFTEDGWMKTDDTGYFDEDNNLYVLGRIKDVIIFGPAFVHPGWLEPKISQHPDILEACVVPVSDPVLHHNICAVVKVSPGSQLNVEELNTFCEAIFLANKNVKGTPVPGFYLILEDFPQTSTGKIDRKALQTMAEEMVGSP